MRLGVYVYVSITSIILGLKLFNWISVMSVQKHHERQLNFMKTCNNVMKGIFITLIK